MTGFHLTPHHSAKDTDKRGFLCLNSFGISYDMNIKLEPLASNVQNRTYIFRIAVKYTQKCTNNTYTDTIICKSYESYHAVDIHTKNINSVNEF